MNITKIGTATLLTSCFVCLSFAEDRPGPRSTTERPSIATEKSGGTYDLAVTATAKPSRSAAAAAAATGVSEVFQNVVVASGNSVSLDSTMDYSAVNTVAVTVQCNVCTSAATSLGTSGLVLQARWIVPNDDLYVAAEIKAATT